MERISSGLRSEELMHYGILGQKWGVRRYQNPDGSYTEAGIKRYQKKYPYQNPDGSLTEEGQKKYMKAARSGKLDYKNLSDKDLDMINNRFNKESQYQRNVENYTKSTFKYKAKEAIISRLKGNGGNGGGGGGKKGKGGGGSFVAELLLTPIKDAFKDALKSDNGGGGGSKDSGGSNEKQERVKAFISGSNGKKSIFDLVSDNSRISTGMNFMGVESTRTNNDDSWKSSSNTTSSDYLYKKHGYKTPSEKAAEKEAWDARTYANAQKNTSNKRKKRAKHGDDFDGICFVITRSSDTLAHHGILGQKWGVRRFQNIDGTYTNAGKERYGKSGSTGSKDDDSSSFDYKTERRKIGERRPEGFSKEENEVITKIQNGEIVDRDSFDNIGYDHLRKQHELGKKYLDENTPEAEKASIKAQMEHEQTLMDYAYDKIPAMNRENEYEKEISSETDSKYIDPTYSKFSNKEEKASAEAEYLENIWYGKAPSDEAESKKFERECQHISDRVWNMSYNGYDGKPQSERIRSMFDYDPDGYHNYDKWKPKYEKTEEWKKLQAERRLLKDKTGYTKAEADYQKAGKDGLYLTDKAVWQKLSNALSKAQQKYSKRIDASDIKQREKKIEDEFNNEITKCVLKDLGYEVTNKNMKLIQGIIWYD